MCGIAGVIGKKMTDSTIQSAIQSIKHRGPDGEGVYCDEGVTLIHTRLSILDLSEKGRQPMCSNDGRYIIVFNGEIYNHLELRTTFFPDHTFVSESDTETLMELFRLKGVGMLSHLRGMFAFVIYDQVTKLVFGARDRMGIKPFLYSTTGGLLTFGSEIGPFKAFWSNLYTIEPKAIRQLMLYGSIQFPYSVLKGVYSLAPGHYFTYEKGVMNKKCYWEFPVEINHSISFKEAMNQFKNMFEKAIDLRLLSDRTVGVFASAGLDSVSILAGLNSLEKKHIQTFTIGFTDPHRKFISEVDDAKKMAEHFGFGNISKLLSAATIIEDVTEFIRHIDQPSIDGFNTFLVSKASKDFLTVALSGLGGDELMLGYPRNVNLYNRFLSKVKIPSYTADKWLIKSISGSDISRNQHRALKYLGNPKNLKLHYWASRLINSVYKVNNDILQGDFAQTWEEDMEEFYAFDSQNYSGDTFNVISYYELRTYMMNQLLRDMDVASMANGIEVRFPLIDHELIELLFSLPSEYKYNPMSLKRNNRTGEMTYHESGVKHILARTYADKFPEGYSKTRKQGFQLPQMSWFAEAFRQLPEVSHDKDKQIEMLFRRSFIQKMKVEKMNESLTNNSFLLELLTRTIK